MDYSHTEHYWWIEFSNNYKQSYSHNICQLKYLNSSSLFETTNSKQSNWCFCLGRIEHFAHSNYDYIMENQYGCQIQNGWQFWDIQDGRRHGKFQDGRHFWQYTKFPKKCLHLTVEYFQHRIITGCLLQHIALTITEIWHTFVYNNWQNLNYKIHDISYTNSHEIIHACFP